MSTLLYRRGVSACTAGQRFAKTSLSEQGFRDIDRGPHSAIHMGGRVWVAIVVVQGLREGAASRWIETVRKLHIFLTVGSPCSV